MLKKYCKEYYDRMYLCENQKWDLEYEVKKRDWEVLQTKKKCHFINNVTYKCVCVLFFTVFLINEKFHAQHIQCTLM